jgi:RimJ/RimL family protein N-acetyltransferase
VTRPQRLAGPRVALVPVPHPVAAAVSAYEPVAAPLAAVGLRAGGGWPHEDTPDALRPLAEHGAAGDAGTWLVVVGGQVVGDCGWFGPPDEAGVVAIGYGLAVPARGQGLGTETVAVLAAWAEQQPGVRLVTAEVLPGNEPSLRLLARLGFRESGSHPPYLRLARAVPGLARPRGRHVC